MNTLKYKCTLLSDIIINVKSASEGVNNSLDFIPGSNFMGIVASKLYEHNDPDTMLIVHSGQVAFGDAHPLVGNTRSIRVPFSMYYPKMQSIQEKCIIHHRYDRSQDSSKLQLKQCREGFYAFSTSSGTFEEVTITKAFSIKSAYDREKRRSKDSQMFGYESIPEGMVYCFSILCPTEDIAAKIDRIIQGRQHIGRSRTAQYGLVRIERYDYDEIKSREIPDGKDTVVYAESRLIFYDETGMPTLQPDAAQLGFEKGTIDWSKSQVRTFMYSPWNFKRQSFDFDRCGIEKGSVLYVKGAVRNNTGDYVGSFNYEGFGKVIYNPVFLEAVPGTNGEAALKVKKSEKTTDTSKIIADTQLVRYLTKQKNHDKIITHAYNLVNGFVDRNQIIFRGNSFASQWGHIRELANMYPDFETLYDKIRDYLTHGVAAEKWKEKGRFKKFDNFLTGLKNDNAQFVIINLAAEMAKKCK